MKNDGKKYESLAEEVFRRLLAQHNVCVDVERDVIIRGKSTDHQIDVYFKFVLGGINYQTVVQCKDWSYRVKQEQIFAFSTVLQDIPGQPRGIFVARSGFQSGAVKFAKKHGIQLYELREPKSEDWDGLIRRIEITGHLFTPEYRNVEFVNDEQWLQKEATQRNVDLQGISKKVRVEYPQLVDFDNNPINLPMLLADSVEHSRVKDWTKFRHVFDDFVAVNVPGVPIPLRKISYLKGEVRVTEETIVTSIRLDHLVSYCFRDVLEGTHEFLDKDGVRLGAD